MESISSKYKDIISKSILISEGSPTVYQLRPKTEKIETLTRLTVGNKNVNKANRTILVVGETGAGKSALINAMANYSMGVRFEDEVWFQIVEEEKRSQIQSQTSDVIVYEIFGFEDETLPYSLTIIDTPGYGDTRGIECDSIVVQRLLDLFRSDDGICEVHAVGLVMKATENRVNDRLSYILNSVMSLFGNNMEKNIVALITHSDGRKPKNPLQALEASDVKCSRDDKNQPVYFLFNNCQHEDRTEEREHLKGAAETSERGMRQFTDFLEKTEAQQLVKTVEVLNERIRLTACIQNLQERIKLTELKQTEIREITRAMKVNEKEMKKNEKFTLEVDEVYKEKEDISGGMWGLIFFEGATCCTVCEENCHFPGCTMAWNPEKCEVMKDGHCTVCTKKCPVSNHVKEEWIYVTKTKKVTRTVPELKEKYEKNQTQKVENKSLSENLEEEMKRLTAEKLQLLNESYQHVVRLEQIALKVDSLSTHVHLDFLIEKMKETGNTEKAQKLQEMKSREGEGTRAALTYMMNKLNFAGKAE
ncbi:septin-2-like [Parambassis ranga]|uniref:Septin-2-like n=1 Tax=Parambassis ranga TaxID=210632 RepID=A0A6P7JSA8_9TELE|nr:septin-2-like [Parambassis ranga]